MQRFQIVVSAGNEVPKSASDSAVERVKTGQSIPDSERLPIVVFRPPGGLNHTVYSSLLTLSGVERNLAAPLTGGRLVPA